jgi:hypothetical protein
MMRFFSTIPRMVRGENRCGKLAMVGSIWDGTKLTKAVKYSTNVLPSEK